MKGATGYKAEQGSHYAPGISAETVGSSVLWFGMVTLPPGQRTKAHIHEQHETAFYFLSGEEVELWTGDRLQHCEKAHPGRLHVHPSPRASRRGQPWLCSGGVCRRPQ